MPTKTCPICRTPFTVSRMNHRRQYCSEPCKNEGARLARQRTYATRAQGPPRAAPPAVRTGTGGTPLGRLDVWLYRPHSFPHWHPREGMDEASQRRGGPVHACADAPAVVVWFPYDGSEPQVWGKREHVRSLDGYFPLKARAAEVVQAAGGT